MSDDWKTRKNCPHNYMIISFINGKPEVPSCKICKRDLNYPELCSIESCGKEAVKCKNIKYCKDQDFVVNDSGSHKYCFACFKKYCESLHTLPCGVITRPDLDYPSPYTPW